MEAFQEIYQNNNEEKYNKCRKKKKLLVYEKEQCQPMMI